MKKAGIILTLLLAAQLSFAQYFTLTPNGFVSADNNDYVVIDFPSVKQEALYKNVLNAINTMYSNPKEGLSVVEGESINLNARANEKIPYKLNEYALDYTLTILFKDEKIRFNSPKFEGYMRTNSGNHSYLKVAVARGQQQGPYSFFNGVYNRNGKLNSKKSYDRLNEFFNALIKEIIDKSNTINNW